MAPATPGSREKRNPNMKIMLIEDDANMRSLLQMLLEMDGHTILPYDGKMVATDILSSLRNNQPNLVIMDVYLQNINGIELLKEIKKNGAGKPMKIIMTSGMNLAQECLDAGADNFLMKPYVPDDLLQLIDAEE